ncbi:MAG UNVERIFIED_CONTAM: hypothetical protein LVT10_09820 [Anaerolineae bacterium]|jgi:hypothetical protein
MMKPNNTINTTATTPHNRAIPKRKMNERCWSEFMSEKLGLNVSIHEGLLWGAAGGTTERFCCPPKFTTVGKPVSEISLVIRLGVVG